MSRILDDDHVATIPAPAVEPASPSAPRLMTLNMGPQHPSTHGVLRIMLELEGETIRKAVADIGFLHTGIEKECEQKTWQQVVTLTDRVDYLANLSDPWVYEQLASCDIHIATGTGQWENSGPSYRLSEILGGKGIRHSLDNWGPEGGHDWPFWKHQMREYISRLF